MKKRERKVLGAYLHDLANALELRDWTIRLSREPVDEETSEGVLTIADVRAVPGRKVADVRVAELIVEKDPEYIRHFMVHELAHLHLVPLQHQCEEDLASLIGRPVETVFFHGFRRNLEYAVDGLASALAKHLPVIDWEAS